MVSMTGNQHWLCCSTKVLDERTSYFTSMDCDHPLISVVFDTASY